MGTSVTLCDVGPRDGLQNERDVLAPSVRAELVNRLAATGLPRIEAVSFVSPARLPQMASAEEVVGRVEARAGVTYAGLVLNERGYDRLVATSLTEVHLTFAVTESFNRRNANASVDDSLAMAERILARARDDGLRATVTLGVAFGCPFEGRVQPGRVLEIAERLVAAGLQELVLADTIGVATPRPVRELVRRAAALGSPIGAHFHDTRNTGIANALAAVDAGASVLDASVAGLGGCPFAPRATGNVASEDLVYVLTGEGVDTGVDLDGLIAVAEWVAGVLGRELPGRVYRAGPAFA